MVWPCLPGCISPSPFSPRLPPPFASALGACSFAASCGCVLACASEPGCIGICSLCTPGLAVAVQHRPTLPGHAHTYTHAHMLHTRMHTYVCVSRARPQVRRCCWHPTHSPYRCASCMSVIQFRVIRVNTGLLGIRYLVLGLIKGY